MKPTRYEGSSIWRDEEESELWYSNVRAQEAAFKTVGIGPTEYTKEMAVRWRATGQLRPAREVTERAKVSRRYQMKAVPTALEAPTCGLNSVIGTKRRTTAKEAI